MDTETAKLMVTELKDALKGGYYKDLQGYFNSLADAIVTEEKDLYYKQHPEEI